MVRVVIQNFLKSQYYRNLRNPWLFLLLMFALFAVTKQSIIFGIFALVSVIPGSIYQIQIITSKNEVHSYVVDYFFQPEEYEKYDYEYVYAITVLFSQKPVSELAN